MTASGRERDQRDGPINVTSEHGGQGDAAALETLYPRLYEHLRELAQRALAGERAAQTLNTTALVHEAWLDLGANTAGFTDRAHFFGYAATAMRHILVDHARRKGAIKRSGEAVPLDIEMHDVPVEQAAAEVLALDAALDRLHTIEPRAARVVELRFFAGLSIDETAEALGIVPRTVVRDWTRARAFLHAALA
jgi:RNA polymerase sigma factor (TIGR02999 family)